MKASERFPLGAAANAKAVQIARWKQEQRIREETKRFRAGLYRACGMKEDPTMEKAGVVSYAPMAKGFDALWRTIEQSNGWSAQTLDACAGNADIRAVLKLLGLGPVTMGSVVAACKTIEFEAYKSDTLYLRCLAAERKALEMLPKLIAGQVTRDHMFASVYQRREAFRDEAEQQAALIQQDVDDMDGADVAALLDQFKVEEEDNG